MYKTFISLLLSFCCIPVRGQITQSLNALRSGDEVIRHTLSMTSPGPAGRDAVWNLSQLAVGRKRHIRRHVREGGASDTISATDRATRYYYNVRQDGIHEAGYENSQTKILFDQPTRLLSFPMTYGDSLAGLFHGTGTYCDRQHMRLFGRWTLTADAEGRIVLPTGDTLYHVMRTHLQKRISCRYHSLDSIQRQLLPISADSILAYQMADDGVILCDVYQWYARGYRYPIIEYQCSYLESQPAEKVSAAHYCSPESQKLLSLDDENIKERTQTARPSTSMDDGCRPAGNNNFTYTFANNSGNRQVYVSYTADAPIGVKGVLASSSGIVYKSLSQEKEATGTFCFDYGPLPRGQYIVYIKTGHEVYTEKFNYQ